MTKYCFDWDIKKGFGENPRITIAQPAESKNSSRAKQVEIFLRKSRKNYLARELKANEGIIPRFVAGVAYHTCAAFKGSGDNARPRAFGYFRHESNVIHDTVNNLLIEGVGKAVILYNYAFVLMRFFTCKQVQNDNPPAPLGHPPPVGLARTHSAYFAAQNTTPALRLHREGFMSGKYK